MNAVSASAHVMMPVAHRVIDRSQETSDTWSITLAPAGDGAAFRPGQFNMLAPFGVGEAAISISGDPADRKAIVHTIRDVGAVTSALTSLAVGDAVGVRGPFGTGWPLEEAIGRDVVIVAGGIGLAPVRPAVLQLLANRDRYGEIGLLYGARTPEDLMYTDDLRDWRGRFDMHCEVTVDRATPGWYGDVGFVTSLLDMAIGRTEDPVLMVCGPEVMMTAVAERAAAGHAAPENIYMSFERNMKCGVGLCGHCQYGPDFICTTGPVLPYSAVAGRIRTAGI